jgi:hypothetical protein
MPTDPEATVRDWNDAILRHDIGESVSLMAADYKRYGDPSWEYPVSKNEWGGFLKSFCTASPTGAGRPRTYGDHLEPSGGTFEAAGAPAPSSRITRERAKWLHPSAQAGRPEAGRRHPPEACRTSERPAYDATGPSYRRGYEVLPVAESAHFNEDVSRSGRIRCRAQVSVIFQSWNIPMILISSPYLEI